MTCAEIPFEGNFDAVINMFTAFGYLESEEEDAKVLQQASKALKPGGQLLLDLLNREWVVLNYIQNEWRKATDGTIYLEHRELDLETSRNRVTVTIISPAGETQQITSFEIRLYTLTEIIAMLDRGGARIRRRLRRVRWRAVLDCYASDGRGSPSLRVTERTWQPEIYADRFAYGLSQEPIE